LWIVDCRRGGSGDPDAQWRNVDYRKVFQQIRKWMAGIHRWTAILLFPAGKFFDHKLREMFALSTECTWRQGVWIFQPHAVPSYTQDLRYNGQVERTVQAIGGVALVMEHPARSKVAPNVRRGGEQLPLAFTDVWNEGRMPSAVDRQERSPIELQRLVQAYLPESWGLVALGITTSIPDIVQQGFIGSEVIVLDDSMDRTRFMYNALEQVFIRDVQLIHSGTGEPGMGPSTNAPTSSPERSFSPSLQENSEVQERGTVQREKEYWDTSDDSDGESYSPSEATDTDEVCMEVEIQEVRAELGVDDGTHVQHTPQVQSANEVAAGSEEVDVPVVIPSTTAENRTTRISESPESHRSPTDASRGEGVTLQPGTADPLQDISQVGAEQVASLTTQGITSNPTIQGTPNEEVFPTTAVGVGTQSTSLSFAWAMADEAYTVGVDGLYYDREGVRYRRLGVEGQYTYEQVTTVLQVGLDVDRVTSPVVDAMVSNALQHVTADTPPEILELLGSELLDEDATEEVGTQSSKALPSPP
jgi:hypothetical protein